MKIYGDIRSGNCQKVRFAADYLGVDYEWVAMDLIKGQSRTPDFLALSPYGQAPVLQLDDGRAFAQSNAILLYLAEGTPLLPADRALRAFVMEQLFWEQAIHHLAIAGCRRQMLRQGKGIDERDQWRVDWGEQALDHLERQLSEKPWLVGDAMTVADISLLAYTRLAHEGGFSLENRPAVRAWIVRCEDTLGLRALA